MKANELLIKHLESEGVKYIFGVPGAPLMPVFHALAAPDSRIKPIICKHEEGGAFMADGYARVSGNLGVCCGTAGPGTTNLITGVAAAFKDSIPMLVLTAQVPTTSFGKGGAQESTGENRSFSTTELLKPITKSSLMVLSADNLSFVIRSVLRNALHPRMGPVHLNLPVDILKREVPSPDELLQTFKLDAAYFDRDKVKEAALALLAAKRPLFLVGRGAILSGASQELVEIAEMLTIPVITSPKAKGAFPEDHPLSLGVFGIGGMKAASNMLLNRGNSDLLFAIGTSFDEWGTNGWDPKIKGEKVLIQVDIDPSQIGKNFPANVGLVGNAKTILKELWFELHRQIKNSRYLPSRSAQDVLDFKKAAQGPSVPLQDDSDEGPIKPQRLIADIRKTVPRDTIFFADSGNHLLWTINCLEIYEPGTFIISLGLAAMGYAVAGAIGGKLAAPDRTVVAICGDGCFFMHGMEVITAVNYGIPVIWVVFNDARLNMIFQGETLQNRPGASFFQFKPVDIAQTARSFGALGLRVERAPEIVPALREAMASGRPAVIDVNIDRDELSPLKDRIRAIQKYMNA